MPNHARLTLPLVVLTAVIAACDRTSPTPTATRVPSVDGPNLSAASGYVNTTIGRTNIGLLNYHTNLNGFNVDLKAHDDADIEVTTGAAQAGGNTGWHYHPGPVLVLVKTGALTVYHADIPRAREPPTQPGRRSSKASRRISCATRARRRRRLSESSSSLPASRDESSPTSLVTVRSDLCDGVFEQGVALLPKSVD